MRIKDLQKLVDNIYNKLKGCPKPDTYLTGGEYYGATQLFRQHGNQLKMFKNVNGTFGQFNCKNAYVVQIGGAYNYEDYKQELQSLFSAFERLAFDVYGFLKIGTRTIRLIHTYGSNYSFYGIDIVD